MELGKEYFWTAFGVFVASNEITDIDYNGKEIWLTNIFNERFQSQSAVCHTVYDTCFLWSSLHSASPMS